jgi:uncharacterized protein YecT (DUF1311 family)
MQYDNATPDLSSLGSDYQILTELHRTPDSRTYLARHLSLQRDVTITVFTGAADMPYLAQFAADTEHLGTLRHPNVVPVLEGRWLNDKSFAVVRAKVRGSSLEQLVSAGGTMPEERVRAAMQQVAAVLVWARQNNITQRQITAESLVFQQGSGRVVVSLDPSARPVGDDQTIRTLATQMLGSTPANIGEYIAMLREAPLTSETSVGNALPDAVPVIVAPVAAAVPVSRPTSAPPRDGDVVVVQRGSSFNARLLSAVAVLAVLAFAAVLFLRNRSDNNSRVAVNVTDSAAGKAAGDVALRSTWDTTMGTQPAYTQPQPTIIAPPPPPVSAYPTPMPMPSQPMPQPMPARPMPMPVQPAPVQAPVRIDTAARMPVSGDICDSPAAPDQHRCLTNAIEASDHDLNSVYQQLISALRKQANTADDQPDPASVADLRASQRRWLQERDDACHSAGSGTLYARERAACFADRSAARARDLKAQLDGIGPARPDTSAAPPFPDTLQFERWQA